MRHRMVTLAAFGALLGSIGMAEALDPAVPSPKSHAFARKANADRAPVSGVAAFPDCPAPAVNGMNVRTVRAADGVGLTVFVVVQNVGNRAFFADAGTAVLRVSIGDRALGSFAVEKLAPSEVRFFAVDTKLPDGAIASDLVATLDFAANTPIGRVSNTLDCQTSDNRSVRRALSLRASLERAAG